MSAVKRVIYAKEVKPYMAEGSAYESRMMLDDIVANERTVNINHGTVKPLDTAGGGSHKKTEIYFIVSGEGILTLDGENHEVSQGSLSVIPGGCVHSIKNISEADDLVILTLWMNAEDNDMYTERREKWGKTFKTIYED
jgi:mannose-6-phosphate isomerase-like protein (cupin superfamily)